LTTQLDNNWHYLKTSQKALEIAFNGDRQGLEGLALELSLRDGLGLITWTRIGAGTVKAAAGIRITDLKLRGGENT
jgi:hypothetical protein